MNAITIAFILTCCLSSISSVILSYIFLKKNVFNEKKIIMKKTPQRNFPNVLIEEKNNSTAKKINSNNKPLLALPEKSSKNDFSVFDEHVSNITKHIDSLPNVDLPNINIPSSQKNGFFIDSEKKINNSRNQKDRRKRLYYIGIQIKKFLDELTEEDELTKKRFRRAVEEKYIKSFIFYAMKSGKSYAELEVTIDWDEHRQQIDKGNIIVKTKSQDGIWTPTKNIAKRFKEYADKNGFAITWRFCYADHIDIKKARKRLDLVSGDVIKHADPSPSYESQQFQIDNFKPVT